MYNEIGRKITSLTLMTIMLAGGMAIAAPGMEPVFAVNPNLFVSTNTFGGPMILEIIINDADYKDDTTEPMPSVTIDGNDLVMAQASSGSWYAYVADTNMVAATEGIAVGLEFGTPYVDDQRDSVIPSGSTLFDDSAIVYAANNGTITVLTNPPDLATVIDKERTLGQIDVVNGQWPFIQTFVFTDDSNINVVYEAAVRQTELVKYDEDMDDFASHSLDRINYPHGADIHLTITDMQLNIDPTNEDKWTFDTSNGYSYKVKQILFL